MILILVIVGAIVVIAAIRNSQADLGNALKQDVPGFAMLALALFAVGAIGFIPQMRQISRLLIALILIAYILSGNRYTNILNGFKSLGSTSSGTTSGTVANATNVANDVNAIIGGMNASGGISSSAATSPYTDMFVGA